MIFVTTSDILRLIEKATNTPDEKVIFVKRIEENDDFYIENYPTGAQIVFSTGENILLEGIVANDFLKPQNN